jgi:hypothetical protein
MRRKISVPINPLETLADRLRGGRSGAVREWRRVFDPQLARIVRRALNQPAAESGYTWRIQDCARQAGLSAPAISSDERELLLAQLSNRCSDTIIEQLQHGPNPGDPLARTRSRRGERSVPK